MTLPRIVLLLLFVAVAGGFGYLAIAGDEGDTGVRQALQVVLGIGFLGFAWMAWRERRAHV